VDTFNYHHLLYFWVVAREGSVTRASELLGLTQPTVSTQVAALEKAFGTNLFRRTGRAVSLTEAGKVAFEYADEIFKLGQELGRVMKDGPTRSRTAKVTVGVADVLPKLIVYKLLEPVYHLDEPVLLQVVEDKTDRLLTQLAGHHLDAVITDSQIIARGMKIKAFHHLLGECGVTIMAAPALARKLRDGYPASLDGAPFLYPSDNTTLRRSLDEWFTAHGITPLNRGEFDDSALLKFFGGGGLGAFAAPTAVESNVSEQFGVQVVARIDAIKERFYAVTVDRKLRHPAVVKITETARQEIFT
jgi:LysR family transcriptional regulator, transcriptional activator of nhaA